MACCGYDRMEAEDILQTSYVKVLSGTARFEGRSTFKTWLFGVIRRTAAELRRRRIVGALLASAVQRLRPRVPPTAPDGTADSAVLSLLRGLSRRQREVLELVFYQDMTIEEAAGVMRVSLGSARTHYHRGKENLRRALANRDERGGGR
jgi:RNA polymerase sigma-70 factor (ECF subfamily)